MLQQHTQLLILQLHTFNSRNYYNSRVSITPYSATIHDSNTTNSHSPQTKRVEYLKKDAILFSIGIDGSLRSQKINAIVYQKFVRLDERILSKM